MSVFMLHAQILMLLGYPRETRNEQKHLIEVSTVISK